MPSPPLVPLMVGVTPLTVTVAPDRAALPAPASWTVPVMVPAALVRRMVPTLVLVALIVKGPAARLW